MKIEIKVLNAEFYEEYLPGYATAGSAAIDLVCTQDVNIYPGETVDIHTGIAIWIGSNITWMKVLDEDIGVAGLILPRSGLGSDGLILANTIGLIDEDYQGELIVRAWNRNNFYEDKKFHYDGVSYNEWNRVELKAGDRFAQLMFVPIIKAQWDVVYEFSSTTDRKTGGFGSTGRS